MKKRYISWEEVDNLINILHNKIFKSSINLIQIYGIPRGGLIPAVMLSHKMDIPITNNYFNNLVVDDICDSGKTLKPFTSPTAVLHYKPHTSIIEPTFYACKFESDDWIVYPWEKNDSKTPQDYKL